MKWLLVLVFIAGCSKEERRQASKIECKVVAEVGGCDKLYCDVKFTDETFTSQAENTVAGMEMCTISGRISLGRVWVIKERAMRIWNNK